MATLQLLVCFTYVLFARALDPCIHNTVLDEPQRSTAHMAMAGGQILCDRLLRVDWYKFKDTEMAFGACVQQYQCGTHVPLWIQGTPPTIYDGTVTRTACGQGRPGGDCCSIKKTVSVRNCGEYMVYYLSPVPGCSIAYCTAPQYPKVGHPKLSPPIVQEPDFKFICEVPTTSTSKPSDVFEVTWLGDGRPIPGVAVETVNGNNRRAEIYGRQLTGQGDKEISCSVTSRFAGSNATSPPSRSAGYWIGVKVSTPRVLVNSHHTTETIKLTSTIPVVCNNIGARDCSVNFRLRTDNDYVFTDSCLVQLKPGSWNAMSHEASVSYVITTEPTWTKTSLTVTHVTATAVSHETGNFWSSMTMPIVQVEKSTDKVGAHCSSTGDPHIKTFDRKTRYTTMSVGQFLMVGQRQWSFRVETRTWRCSPRGAGCNCAVAAREGNDVITFDMCHGRVGFTVPKIEIKNPSMFTNQTKIWKDPSGHKYVACVRQVTFRSGAMVTVVPVKRALNVFVDLPASFNGDTEGLCGFLDGDEANDLTRSDGKVDIFSKRPGQFVNSWRIRKGHSLFEVASPLPVTNSASSTTITHCSCSSSGVGHGVCSAKTPQANHTQHVLCPSCIPVHVTLPVPSGGVTSPSVTSPPITTMPTTPYSYHQTTTLPLPVTTSSPLMHVATATQTCETALKKDPALVACVNKQMTLEYKDMLDLCVMDMQLTNDSDMALSAVIGLMQDCVHHTLVSPPSMAISPVAKPIGPVSKPTGPVSEPIGPVSKPISPVAKVCPRACSLNGDCVDGKCVCYPGFESTDCSVKSGAPPSITGISGGDFCDRKNDNCFEPTVMGENMKDNMTCVIKEISVYGGKEEVSINNDSPAVFHSTTYVGCKIKSPPKDWMQALQRYAIYLSTDAGTTFGNQYNYTVYNSQCLECGKNPNCTLLPGTCMINGKCFPAGAEDKDDHQGYCVPAQSKYDWSPTQQTSSATATTTAGTSSTVVDFRHYTGTSTGCGCYYDPSRADCACCRNSGCPCGQSHHNRCYDCFHDDMCSATWTR